MQTVSEVRQWLKQVPSPQSAKIDEFTTVVSALHDAKDSNQQRLALRAALKYFNIRRSRTSRESVLLTEARQAIVRKANWMQHMSTIRNEAQGVHEASTPSDEAHEPQRAHEPQQLKRQPLNAATHESAATPSKRRPRDQPQTPAKRRAPDHPHKRNSQSSRDAAQLATTAQSNEDQPRKKVHGVANNSSY